MQRSQARSWTLIAQVSTMGLVALVAFVAVAGVPGMAPPVSAVPPMPEPEDVDPQASGRDERAIAQRIEIKEIIDTLKNLPNAPKIVEIEARPIDGTGNPTPTVVAFLGAVISTNHRAAMLRADDDKAWVGEGQSWELGGLSVFVSEVHSDHVRIEINGAEQRLDRAERTGSAVARVVQSEDRDGRNERAFGAMDFNGRRRGMDDAREMLRAPTQDSMQLQRNRATNLLERADEMQESNPDGADRLRRQAERLLSINPGIPARANEQDPER